MTFTRFTAGQGQFKHTRSLHLGDVRVVDLYDNGPQINTEDGKPLTQAIEVLSDSGDGKTETRDQLVLLPGRSIVVQFGDPIYAIVQLVEEGEMVAFLCEWVAFQAKVDADLGMQRALDVLTDWPDMLKTVEQVVAAVTGGSDDDLNDQLMRDNEALRTVVAVIDQGEQIPDAGVWAGLFSMARTTLARARRIG